MQNDKTLIVPQDGSPAYRELALTEDVTLRAFTDRLLYIHANGSEFELTIPEAMGAAEFIVHLMPVFRRLNVAASLTTSVAKAIGG